MVTMGAANGDLKLFDSEVLKTQQLYDFFVWRGEVDYFFTPPTDSVVVWFMLEFKPRFLRTKLQFFDHFFLGKVFQVAVYRG